MGIVKLTRTKSKPETVCCVYDAKLGMEGFLVIDSTVLGPGKGGIRMTPDVTEQEVVRLARTMTWKNALAGIPFGGAKAGIRWPGGSPGLKKQFVQSFARALKPFMPGRYIAGPDVNSGEREMRWFATAAQDRRVATGKPRSLGGLPHELGSTGFGVAHAARIAAEVAGFPLRNATVAIEGFGNVGTFAMRHLTKLGARVVAVADSRGTAYRPSGLDFATLARLKARGRSVRDYPGARSLPHDRVFSLPVDILVPAAVTDAIHKGNWRSVKAKIIVEGSNIPMRESIERKFFTHGTVVVPDFVANAGGVISSYAEHRGYDAPRMFRLVEEKVVAAAREVLTESQRRHIPPRTVAMEIARRRVQAKMRERRSTF